MSWAPPPEPHPLWSPPGRYNTRRQPAAPDRLPAAVGQAIRQAHITLWRDLWDRSHSAELEAERRLTAALRGRISQLCAALTERDETIRRLKGLAPRDVHAERRAWNAIYPQPEGTQ